jgi:hypothetical protein
MEREEDLAAGLGMIAQGRQRLLNFVTSRHENESILLMPRANLFDQRTDGPLPNRTLIQVGRPGGVGNLDRKGSAFAVQGGSLLHEALEQVRIKRGRHDEDEKVRPPRRL